MKRIAAGLALLAAACSSTPPVVQGPSVGEQEAQIREDCRRRINADTPARAVAIERCANTRVRAAHVAAGDDQIDILDTYLAEREVAAEKLSDGAITETEFKAEVARARTRAASEWQARRARAVGAAAASRAARGTMCITSGAVTNCY